MPHVLVPASAHPRLFPEGSDVDLFDRVILDLFANDATLRRVVAAGQDSYAHRTMIEKATAFLAGFGIDGAALLADMKASGMAPDAYLKARIALEESPPQTSSPKAPKSSKARIDVWI